MANNRSVRFSKRRSRMEWSASFLNDFLVLAANSVSLQTSPVALVETLGDMTSPTIIRIRGNGVVMATGGTIGDDVMVGMGIGIVSSKAGAAGIAAVPAPLTDPTFPWMWHRFIPLRFLSAADELTPDVSINRFEIDAKAMRKILSDEEELIFVTETSNAVGTASISFSHGIRILIKQV